MFLNHAVNFALSEIPVCLIASHICKYSEQIGLYIVVRGRQSVHKFTHWQCMPPCTLHEVVNTSCQFTHLLLPQQKKTYWDSLQKHYSLFNRRHLPYSLAEIGMERACDSPNFPVGNNVGKHSTSKCFNLLLNASSFTFISL